MKKDLFRRAAADFDHPLEMIAACHDRIEDRCELLLRLCRHVRDVGPDEQARQAAANVMRYFDTAGENHHQDEEDDLFPRLLAADRPRCEPLVTRLVRDHRAMREAWEALRSRLSRIAAGENVPLEADEIERFTSMYLRHIDLEERELLPIAQRLLDVPTLRAIGETMAQRRNVPR